MDSLPHLRFVIAGRLTREYTILPSGETLEDVPGGALLYAAAGLAVWDRGIGLVGRIGKGYPAEWIEKIQRNGFDCRGIRRLEEAIDQRHFAAYPDPETSIVDNPVAQYAQLGLSFPKSLLGFIPSNPQVDSRTRPIPTTLRQNDLPSDYLEATAAHICPLDYLSHTLLPPTLHQGHIHTITLDPGTGYMNPTYWDDMPVILHGLTGFLCSEEKLRALFQGRSNDLWEMAEGIAAMGCEIVVVKRGASGQYLYEKATHSRWMIPAYPATIRSRTGAGDAFCGGFLAGLRATYDPLQAALQGNISSSFVFEGTHPFYAPDVLPGLPQARLGALRDMVRRA
jgi:sugar/nucleoside kinase (ribokinase family)